MKRSPGRPGWDVPPGDQDRHDFRRDHIHRTFIPPQHGITVGQWFSEPTPELVQILLDADADGEIRLQEDYHPVFEKVLRRNGL